MPTLTDLPAEVETLLRHRPDTAADEVRQSCARLILDVLRPAEHPLTLLDILDDLGHHYRGWTSPAVRHTLAELVDRGVVAVRRDLRPCGYALAPGQAAAHPG
jgi:hypothetical protein